MSKSDKKSVNNTAAKPIIIGTVCGSALCTALLIATSLFILKKGCIPYEILETVMLISTVISSFVSGFIAGKIHHKNGLLFGTAAGFTLFVIIFFGGLIAVGESVSLLTFTRALLMILAGGFGGILGVNSRKL